MSQPTETIEPPVRRALLAAQRNELTEHQLYLRLAAMEKNAENSKVLAQIAQDELRHARFWQRFTQQQLEPDRARVRWFSLVARVLGLTFAVKQMERGEGSAQELYRRLATSAPGALDIVDDEDRHEHQLIDMLDEERLRYVGSIVLGLNDALVELTGTLAGLTLALQNTRLIAMTGLVTGIAASLSMAASEYLSTKAEGAGQHAVRSALYTGATYVVTVTLLILPYFILQSYIAALVWTLCQAVLIILLFTYYIAVAKDLSFRRRFLEMAGISLGVAAFSFGVGLVVHQVLGVSV
jgi:VIT1/CCC1 family predicted Fe2+/Mn2+ transporter